MAALLFLGTQASAFTKTDIESLIRISALRYGVEPDVAIAVAQVESGLNDKAVGSLGELGVFQLRPEYHNVLPGATAYNIDLGVRYLAYVRAQCEPDYGPAWMNCFNHGPYKRVHYPTLFPYYRKVVAVLKMRQTYDFDVTKLY